MVIIRRQTLYTKLADELIHLPNMTKNEIVDWWIAKQDNGFLKSDKLTVQELMHLQEHKERYCHIKVLLQRDKSIIYRRIRSGEKSIDIAKEYNLSVGRFNKNLNSK